MEEYFKQNSVKPRMMMGVLNIAIQTKNREHITFVCILELTGITFAKRKCIRTIAWITRYLEYI
jgi:hypothetical protein